MKAFQIPFVFLSISLLLVGCFPEIPDFSCVDDSDCSSGTCYDGVCVVGMDQGGEADLADTETPELCGGEICGESQACCEDACIEVFNNDQHCGACGVVCGPSETCVEESCVCGDWSNKAAPACPGGWACCDNACVDLNGDPAHCGGCGVACAIHTEGDPEGLNQSETCQLGACLCPIGQGNCDEVLTNGCETELLSNRVHCGACGNTCMEGWECCDGECVNVDTSRFHCGACGSGCSGQTLCKGGECGCVGSENECDGDPQTICETDLSSDDLHCGYCNTACEAPENCSFGRCGCGGENCEGGIGCCELSNGQAACVSDGNLLHCGGCEVACDPQRADNCDNGVCRCGQTLQCDEGTYCQGGECESELSLCLDEYCGEGEICAGPTNNALECYDVSSSVEHCGSAENTCSAGQACVDGVCVCPAGTLLCGGACTDPYQSNEHCGACGNPCESGSECCDGVCVDTNENALHCGGCGVNCSSGTCTSGTCSCAGVAVDLLTSEDHCGACGNACPGGTCQAGVCTCDGIEVDLLGDVANCGECGNACPQEKETSQCVSGSCEVVSCDEGFVDCDLEAENGCEVSINNDAANCGACGTTCDPGTVCVDQFCVWPEVVQLSSGDRHTCALLNDKGVYCWGAGLGIGAASDRAMPAKVEGLFPATMISAGWNFTCALGENGMVYCWGAGENGQLGDGFLANSLSPVRVSVAAYQPLEDVKTIGCGSGLCCATRQDQRLFCWGAWADGRSGAVQAYAVPYGDSAVADQVCAGSGYFCFVSSTGALQCKGEDDDDRLGDSGDFANWSVSQVACGPKHACARLSNGDVYCWGDGGDYRNGYFWGDTSEPKKVDEWSGAAIDLALGGAFSCALTQDGSLWCWGNDYWAQLGDGSWSYEHYTPREANYTNGKALSPGMVGPGDEFQCVSTGTEVACWGRNESGQLGYFGDYSASPRILSDFP